MYILNDTLNEKVEALTRPLLFASLKFREKNMCFYERKNYFAALPFICEILRKEAHKWQEALD